MLLLIILNNIFHLMSSEFGYKFLLRYVPYFYWLVIWERYYTWRKFWQKFHTSYSSVEKSKNSINDRILNRRPIFECKIGGPNARGFFSIIIPPHSLLRCFSSWVSWNWWKWRSHGSGVGHGARIYYLTPWCRRSENIFASNSDYCCSW